MRCGLHGQAFLSQQRIAFTLGLARQNVSLGQIATRRPLRVRTRPSRETAHYLQSAAELAEKIEAARDDVKAAYQDAKKYEIAQERKLERERLELARRERVVEDDVALDMVRRKL